MLISGPPGLLQHLSPLCLLLTLHRLQALHGNKWKLIGDKMDRSACAVRTRYNYINRKDKTGLLECVCL